MFSINLLGESRILSTQIYPEITDDTQSVSNILASNDSKIKDSLLPSTKFYDNCLNTDALYYYQSILNKGVDKSVLKMSDTLYRMVKYPEGKCIALSIPLNYYYSINKREYIDSVNFYASRLKDYAKDFIIPSYYYAWNKLISYYVKCGYSTYALSEVHSLQREAQKDGYKWGIIQSYIIQGNIFLAKRSYKMAESYYDKALKFMIEDDVNVVNSFTLYGDLANVQIQMKKYDEALKNINIGESLLLKQPRRLYFYKLRVKLAIKNKDYVKAHQYLDTIKLYSSDNVFTDMLNLSNDLKISEYESREQYTEIVKFISDVLPETVYFPNRRELLERRANAYVHLGMVNKSAQDYQTILNIADSLYTVDINGQLLSSSRLLDFQRLKSENQRLKIKKERISTVLKNILLLFFSLFFILSFFYLKRLKKKNTIINKKNEEIAQGNLIKTAFIRNISHEIRTPLNYILGYSELIAMENPQLQNVQKYLSIIKKGNRELLEEIDNILDISYALDRVSPDTFRDINVDALCKDVINLYKYKEKNIKMIYQPFKENFKFKSHRYTLKHTLSALINNAYKFSDSGEIVCSTNYYYKKNKKYIAFTITDNGKGIGDVDSEILFSGFTKTDEFTQGIGLGLTASRLMCRNIDGDVFFDESYKNGAKVIAIFPLLEGE